MKSVPRRYLFIGRRGPPPPGDDQEQRPRLLPPEPLDVSPQRRRGSLAEGHEALLDLTDAMAGHGIDGDPR